MEGDRPVQRRRGERLETALLQAAWDEVVERGWTEFSIPRVADRASAGRASVYARWPNKAAIIAAAARRHAEADSVPIDLSGDLDANLHAALVGASEFLGGPFGAVARALAAELPNIPLAERVMFDDSTPVHAAVEIVEHARATGELGPGEVPVRVFNVGYALVTQQFLFTGVPPGRDAARDITTTVWLPLLKAFAPPPDLTDAT